MQRHPKLLADMRNGLIGGILAAFGGLCFHLFPIGQGLEHVSFDFPTLFNARIVSDEVVIIQMDEVSSREMNPYRGPVSYRSWHARLLDRIRNDGGKMVVLDVFLKGPGPAGSEDADDALARALRSSLPVVLAAERTPVAHPRIRDYTIFPPWTNFLSGSNGWGVAAVEPDSDDVVRKQYPGTDLDPSLPWAAAVRAGAPIGAKPDTRLTDRWIRYYGPYGTIRSLSYHMAFDQAPGFYRDKTVIIGGKPLTPRVLDEVDEFKTPYTRRDRQYTPGSEIIATTFLNLMHGDSLTRLSADKEGGLILISGLVFGFLLSRFRPLGAALVSLVGLLAVTAFAFWLFWSRNLWFSWAVIAIFQIPCAWICSAVGQTLKTSRENELLEKELSTRPPAQKAAPPPFAAAPRVRNPASRATIPDHELLRCVGQGAYGEVWLARNAIGTYHAVKIVFQSDFSTADSYAREFRGIQKYMPISLNHPGLVHILHIGRNDEEGYYYCIMEAGDDEAAGQSIDPEIYSPRNLAKDLRRRGKLPVDECIALTLTLAEALQFLHAQGLIHRDIKPSNVIFVQGKPKLADIGLVTSIAGKDEEMSAVGTEGYMAPEGPGTPAADIFSLGKVLYEASMGRDREKFPELPTSLEGRRDSAALVRLNAIILKACEADVRRRYQSLAELRADLLKLI